MSSQLSARLGTETIELTAGGDGKSFVVHKNLLIIQSSFLCSAVGAVSAEQKYDLQSWDGETVGHFVNFLYLHTYDAPTPQPLCPIAGTVEGSTTEATGTPSRVSTPGTVFSNSSTQLDHCMDQTDPLPITPLSGLCDQPDDGDNEGQDSGPSPVADKRLYSNPYPQETHDYHDVLLAHARVYALARSLEVDVLCTMAYQLLLVVLESLRPITPGSRNKSNVVELLRYVYDHTQDPGDRMRELVSQFIVLNFTALQNVEELMDLMSGGGQLTVDLLAKVCRRLVAGEVELDNYRELSKGIPDVTEQLRVERLKVEALEISNGHMDKSLKAMVFDLNSALQQLKVLVSRVKSSGGHRGMALREIETMQLKNEQAMKDMNVGKECG